MISLFDFRLLRLFFLGLVFDQIFLFLGPSVYSGECFESGLGDGIGEGWPFGGLQDLLKWIGFLVLECECHFADEQSYRIIQSSQFMQSNLISLGYVQLMFFKIREVRIVFLQYSDYIRLHYLIMQIRAKTAQFKDDFRKRQTQVYRKAIRQQLVAERLSQLEQMELNNQVALMIQQQNLGQIYELLYRGKNNQSKKVPISSLKYEILVNLLGFLIQNMLKIESLLLINNIIDIQYNSVFLNQQNIELVQLLVRNLYCFCHNLVVVQDLSQFNLAKKLINAALNCIKSLIFNKEQQQNGYKFQQVVRLDYIVTYLFAWLQKLIQNPLYLIAITILEYDMEISSIEPIRQYLNHNPKTIQQLIRQGDPQNNSLKSCALPSVSLANAFIKKIDNKQTLCLIAKECLQSSKVIYNLTSKANRQFYRMHTFIESISVIAEVFRKLADDVLQTSLCQMMADQNYWVFSNSLLRLETYHTREIILRIVLYAIQNAIKGKVKLQNYISETAVGLFVQGLQQSNQSMMRCSMEIFTFILCYCKEHIEQTRELRDWIGIFQIEVSLENLQHLKNKELAEWATKLLGLKNELDEGTAMQEESA